MPSNRLLFSRTACRQNLVQCHAQTRIETTALTPALGFRGRQTQRVTRSQRHPARLVRRTAHHALPAIQPRLIFHQSQTFALPAYLRFGRFRTVAQLADDAVDVAGTTPATRAVVRVEASNGLTRLCCRDIRTQFRMKRVKLNIIPLSVA